MDETEELHALCQKLADARLRDDWSNVQSWAKSLKIKYNVTWRVLLETLLNCSVERGLINYLSSSTSYPSKNENSKSGKLRYTLTDLFNQYSSNSDEIDEKLSKVKDKSQFEDDVCEWFLSRTVPGVIRMIGKKEGSRNVIFVVITSKCDKSNLEQLLTEEFAKKYNPISIQYEREEYLSCALNASGHYGTGTLIHGPKNSFWILSARHVFEESFDKNNTDTGIIKCIPHVHPLTKKFERVYGLPCCITDDTMWHISQDIGLAYVHQRTKINDIPLTLTPLPMEDLKPNLLVYKDGVATQVSLGYTRNYEPENLYTIREAQIGRFAIHGDSGSLVREVDSGAAVGIISSVKLREELQNLQIGDTVITLLSPEIIVWLNDTMNSTLDALGK